MKRLSMLLCFILLCSLSISDVFATTLLRNPCPRSHYKENILNAKYIVVARLEKYLDGNMGEFRVLMNLRGPIQPGVLLQQKVIPIVKSVELPPVGAGGDPIGVNYIFLGNEYDEFDDYFLLKYFQCDGRFGVVKLDDHAGRPALDPVINYILDGRTK